MRCEVRIPEAFVGVGALAGALKLDFSEDKNALNGALDRDFDVGDGVADIEADLVVQREVGGRDACHDDRVVVVAHGGR